MGLLGVAYLAFKLLADSIWISNVYRHEFNGHGDIVQRGVRRTIHILMILQVCTLLKFVGERSGEAVLCVLGLIILTMMFQTDFKSPFINPKLLDEHRVEPDDKTLQDWFRYFRHPIQNEPELNSLINPFYEYKVRNRR